MTRGRLIFNSLTHHARSHLGTLLGVVVASAVLIGALVVGDSVRFSLRQHALKRLGGVRLALVQHDRFFRDANDSAFNLQPVLSKELDGFTVDLMLFLLNAVTQFFHIIIL